MTDRQKTVLAITFALALVLAGWIGSSWQEAKIFNHHTGLDISTWDAMWITLRITEQGRPEHRGPGGDPTLKYERRKQ